MNSINNWSWDSWVAMWEKEKMELKITWSTRVNPKYIKDLNVGEKKKKNPQNKAIQVQVTLLSESNPCLKTCWIANFQTEGACVI